MTSSSLPSASTTTLTSSLNPSTYGASVTLTATVTPTAATGTVTFKEGATTLGTVALSDGVATLTTSALAAGSHSLTAEYAGESGYAGSASSPALVQTVNKATPTATLAVDNSPVTYDGTAKAATVVVSSSSTPGAAANILTGGAATQTVAGTYAVTADFVPTDSANYNTLSALSAGNFVIAEPLPVVGADAFVTALNTPAVLSAAKLKANDSGSGLTITGVTSPSAQGGTVILSGPDGLITYTPPSGYAGTDSFAYVLTNDQGGSVNVTVTATVGAGTGQSFNRRYTAVEGGEFVVRFAGIPGEVYTVEHADAATGPWSKYGPNRTASSDNSLGFGIGVFEVRESTSNSPARYFRTVHPAY